MFVLIRFPRTFPQPCITLKSLPISATRTPKMTLRSAWRTAKAPKRTRSRLPCTTVWRSGRVKGSLAIHGYGNRNMTSLTTRTGKILRDKKGARSNSVIRPDFLSRLNSRPPRWKVFFFQFKAITMKAAAQNSREQTKR